MKKQPVASISIVAPPSQNPRPLAISLWILTGVGVLAVIAGLTGFASQRVWIS
jgi:hypothetical protein